MIRWGRFYVTSRQWPGTSNSSSSNQPGTSNTERQHTTQHSNNTTHTSRGRGPGAVTLCSLSLLKSVWYSLVSICLSLFAVITCSVITRIMLLISYFSVTALWHQKALMNALETLKCRLTCCQSPECDFPTIGCSSNWHQFMLISCVRKQCHIQ